MRASLLVFLFAGAISAVRLVPSSVAAARQDFSRRRDSLIDAYVELTIRQPLNNKSIFGAFKDHGSGHSFRRIAAHLLAYKTQYFHRDNYQLKCQLVSPNTPKLVADWTRGIKRYSRPGTDTSFTSTSNADYDTVMKEMVSLIYLFKDESQLLTNDAIFNILEKGLTIRGQGWGSHMRFKVLYTYPESENHVLMTLSSMYLTNQWLYTNPRNDPRLNKYKGAKAFKNTKSFEDILLQAVGRIVHSDYFETNARPYQALTFHVLLNLYAFADNPLIREGARNALDFTMVKFAFQSFEGKRLVPQRRQSNYINEPSIYDHDSLVFVMAILSGNYQWNDTVVIDKGQVDPTNYFPISWNGNGMGTSLWAALLSDSTLRGNRTYIIPRPIHGFMLRKPTPFWARMQGRFTEKNYVTHHWPRYFTNSSQVYSSGKFEFAPELYYGTDHFLNTAGGRFNSYPLDRPGDRFLLDWGGKPSYIMPRGFVRNWGKNYEGAMTNDTIILTSYSDSARSVNNIGTYKGFTYGYDWVPNAKAIPYHEPWPIPPQSWASSHYVFSRGSKTLRFKFYDATRYDLPTNQTVGFYLVTASFETNTLQANSKNKVVRGFWEVVPYERFPNLAAFQDFVLANNRGESFQATLSKYRYYMTTGEWVDLWPDAGFKNVGGIAGIWVGQKRVKLSDYHVDASNDGKYMPLIDVSQLDGEGKHTGVKYVTSKGSGKIFVYNPFEEPEASLCINSERYDFPYRAGQQACFGA